MKENYIKNKIASFLDAKTDKQNHKRLEANRVAARVGNLVAMELNKELKELERRMTVFVHDAIKAELK